MSLTRRDGERFAKGAIKGTAEVGAKVLGLCIVVFMVPAILIGSFQIYRDIQAGEAADLKKVEDGQRRLEEEKKAHDERKAGGDRLP